MWKTYSGEILFRVGSHVFAKAMKSLKAGEESVLHDEARIERDSFFESSSYLSKRFFKEKQVSSESNIYLKIIVVLRSPFFHS